MTVWKYVLKPTCELEMPAGSQLLDVHEQNGEICMWVLVDVTKPKVHRTFHVAGTGHILPDGEIKYVGTAYLPDVWGKSVALVFHVFEVL